MLTAPKSVLNDPPFNICKTISRKHPDICDCNMVQNKIVWKKQWRNKEKLLKNSNIFRENFQSIVNMQGKKKTPRGGKNRIQEES